MGLCFLEPLVVQCACQGIYNAFFLEFCLDLGKTGHIAEPRKTADNSSAFNEGNLVHHDRADHTFGHAVDLFLRNDRNLPKEHFLFPVGGVKFYIPAQFLFRLTEDIIQGRKVEIMQKASLAPRKRPLTSFQYTFISGKWIMASQRTSGKMASVLSSWGDGTSLFRAKIGSMGRGIWAPMKWRRLTVPQ